MMLTWSEMVNDMNDKEWLEFVTQNTPHMDFTLERLIMEADESCRFRGHYMRWEKFDGYIADGTCTKCGKGVRCLTNPMPNQIDIGGEAVALGCN